MKKLTTISLFIFFCVVTAILTAGLVFYQNKKDANLALVGQNTNTEIVKLASSGVTILDLKEVAKHNTNANCWIIVSSKVYDISNYASAHPGGTGNILDYCGKEATQAFNTQGGKGNSHSASANNLLAQYYLGNLNQRISQSIIDANIQKIKSKPLPVNKGNDDEDDD